MVAAGPQQPRGRPVAGGPEEPGLRGAGDREAPPPPLATGGRRPLLHCSGMGYREECVYHMDEPASGELSQIICIYLLYMNRQLNSTSNKTNGFKIPIN